MPPQNVHTEEDALREVHAVRAGRAHRPHVAERHDHHRPRCGARSTCATATRRSSIRWTRPARCACSKNSSRWGSRRSRSGFPSASQPDFDFVRQLIEEDRIPDDVTIQVLVQCRQELIERTYECLQGAPRAIVHFYNSTNPLQREVVFGLDKDGIIDVAVNGAKLCRKLEHAAGDTRIRYEYSPESFTLTEPEFAIEICEAVMDVRRADARQSDRAQPARHRRVLLPQRVRRRHRVVRPHDQAARQRRHLACTRTTTVAAPSPRPSSV